MNQVKGDFLELGAVVQYFLGGTILIDMIRTHQLELCSIVKLSDHDISLK